MSQPAFWALCSAAFATAFGYGAIMPVLPLVLERAGLDASQGASSWHAGALGGLYMLAIVVCAPLWGMLSDRFGRRKVITAGLAGCALAFVLSAAATSLVLAYVARGLAGAFAAAVLPVAAAATAVIVEEKERARKFAGLSATILLGYFVGPAVTAWLATMPEMLSGPVAGSQYASAAMALLALAAVAFVPDRPVEVPAEERERCETPHRLPIHLLLLNFTALFGIGVFEIALPLGARGALGLDDAAVSLLFVECSALMIVAQGVLLLVHDRGRLHYLLAAGFAAYGAGLLLLAVPASPLPTSLAVGLIAAGSGIVLPVIGYLAALEAGQAAGAAFGTLVAAGSLGQAVGSFAGGAGYANLGIQIFTAAALAMGLGAALGARYRPPSSAVGVQPRPQGHRSAEIND
jgi:predicted MFS family arabinose efflux permease